MGTGRTSERRHRLRTRREELRLSIDQVARAIGVDRKTVWRWETGQSDPYRRQHPAIADTLQWPLDRIEELLVRADADPPAQVPAHLLAGGRTSPADPEPAGDPAAVLRADVHHLASLSDRYGSDDVLPLALRLTKVARDQHSDDNAMLAAVAEASELAGWVAFDAGQPDLARRLDHEAIVVARLAGDQQLETFTLANLAMLDVSHGQPAEAAAIADHVLADHPHGNVAALFRLRQARTHAQAGDRTAALDALARAETTADGDGPWWAWWVTPAELAWHRGATFGDLGDWTAAADAYRASLEQSASDSRRRSMANTLTVLADAQQRANDLAGLEATLQELLGYGDVASGRNTALLRHLATRIRRSPNPSPSALTNTADQLAQLLATTSS